MKYRILFILLLTFLFTGCQSYDKESVLISRVKNGDSVTYVYYIKGEYKAYYFESGELVRVERLEK